MKRLFILLFTMVLLTICAIILVYKGDKLHRDEFGYEVENINIYKLNQAIDKNDINFVKKIIATNDINKYPLRDVSYYYADYYNVPPLGYACINENLKMVKLLINKGADLNLKTIPLGETPLMLALKYNGYDKSKIVKLLIELGSDLNVKNSDGNITISSGTFSNGMYDEKLAEVNLEVLRLLVKYKVDLSGPWNDRLKALALSAIYNDLDIAVYILEQGNVNINQVIDDGSFSDATAGATVLILAVKNNSYEVVQYLLSKNAAKDKRDLNGKSALDYALESDNKELVKLFND
ncbi:MAG: hypothetical protein HFH47_00150 [Bacilli bacterium]|nr:hypothetical protein [Bacilli bacterium]